MMNTSSPSPEKLLRYYKSFARRRRIQPQSVEDVAQEMFCQALEQEQRTGIPYYQQSKWFLFSHSMKHLWGRFKKESIGVDVRFAESVADWIDANWMNTTADGRRFLRKYKIACNEVIVEMDAHEIVEFMGAHGNVAPMNVVTNLKKHPHSRWLHDGVLYKSKKDCAERTGRAALYKAKPKLIDGTPVVMRIV
jgi:hypothetical protein